MPKRVAKTKTKSIKRWRRREERETQGRRKERRSKERRKKGEERRGKKDETRGRERKDTVRYGVAPCCLVPQREGERGVWAQRGRMP